MKTPFVHVRDDRAERLGRGEPPFRSDALAFTIAQAARMIGISSRTLCKYVSAGELQSILIGKRRLIRRVDLERFLEARLDRRCREPATSTAAAD